MGPSGERCMDCYFHDGDEGYCRRYPPVRINSTVECETNDVVAWNQPAIWSPEHEWCGEFKPRPKDGAA